MSDTLKALDDLGELLDQLASNAREFDYNTANRMERDAAKALLAIEAAVNALPELVALRKENERLREALCIETKGSLTWWVDRAAQYAEDMGEEGFLIDRDHWERIVFTAQTEAAHAALKERNDV